ncbi:MAG: hypothetical protein KGO82_19845 [Bacteroidota bacterium]|nr:hypothetical protein [Bacteroidota bacterium]
MKTAIFITMITGGMLGIMPAFAQSTPVPAAKRIVPSSETGEVITGKKIQQESLRRTTPDTLIPVKSYVHYTPRKRTRRGE